MRLVFMGTPAFALPTLEALAGTHEIVAVYTQPPRPAGRGQKDKPSPVHEFALAHKIPVHIPESLKTKEAQDTFIAHKAEAAVVVAYGLLLPKVILEAYPLGCINVHPSLLPRWRGAAPIQRTVMAGDTETGIVIMQMDEGLDTGGMLLVEKFPVPDIYDAGMLHDELARKAAPMVLKTLDGLKSGSIKAVKQPEVGVTYAKKISKNECRIDWSRPALEIRNQIRGLSPTPGAFFNYNGETIKIFDALAMSTDKGDLTRGVKSGEVVSHHLDIACDGGKSILSPLEMQRPGKKRMHKQDLLQGFAIPPGSHLT